MPKCSIEEIKQKILEYQFDSKYLLEDGTLLLAAQELNDQDAIEIASVLPSNCLISKVVLTDNNIGFVGALAFTANHHNAHLALSVELSNNPITNEDSSTIEQLMQRYKKSNITLILQSKPSSLNAEINMNDNEHTDHIAHAHNVHFSQILRESPKAAILKLVMSEQWNFINAQNFSALANIFSIYYHQLQKSRMIWYFSLKKSANKLLIRLLRGNINKTSAIIDTKLTSKLVAKMLELFPSFNTKEILQVLPFIRILVPLDKELIEAFRTQVLNILNHFTQAELRALRLQFLALKIYDDELLTELNNQLNWLSKFSTDNQVNQTKFDFNEQTENCSTLREASNYCEEIVRTLQTWERTLQSRLPLANMPHENRGNNVCLHTFVALTKSESAKDLSLERPIAQKSRRAKTPSFQ